MISLPRIARQMVEGQFDAILSDVVRNGRPLPLSVRLRLSEPEALPVSALGLALQRVLELTYRPTEVSIALLRGLLDRAREDGSFGSLSATAVALASMLAFRAQIDALPGVKSGAVDRYLDPALDGALRRSIEGALGALSAAWDIAQDEAIGPALLGDEIDTAVALWQLAFAPAFGRAVPIAALFDAAEAHGLLHDRRTAPLLGSADLALHPAAKERAA